MASESLSDKGRLEIEVVVKGTQEIARLVERMRQGEEVADELQGAVDRVGRATSNLEGDLRKGGKGASAMSDEFKGLIKQLNEFNKAHREATQQGVAGGSLDGKGRAELQGLSTDQLKQYIAIDDARGVNAVSVARQIVAAREKETQASLEAAAAAERLRVSETGSRGYGNTSVLVDAGIDQDRQAGAAFSAGLKARLEDEVKATKAANSAKMASTAQYYKDASAGAASVAKGLESTLGPAQQMARYVPSTFGQIEKSATTASAAVKEHNVSLISARYALYDVATTYGILSAAMIGASALAVTTGARFESAFTNVERTSNDSVSGLQNLRGELADLSTQIPLTFEELSKIATLGNQLGIAEGDVESFTQTVAQFATVTGMTVEASATAFGSLGELLNLSADEYNSLGSAIAYVGRQSVATEPEIVALATRLAASATNAGFSAQEVIALSGALASLRVAPERAQGVMEVYFNRLNNALANGGSELSMFASLAGTTTDEIGNLVATDPNKFFRDFSAGLGKLDPVAQTQALEALGLSGIRAGEVFGRVSGNLGVFDKALSDSNKSYREATELADQYAKVVDDLNSRWMMFVNSVNALIDAFSGGAVSSVADFLAVLTDVVNRMRAFADNPVARSLATLVIIITTVTGLYFGFAAVTALATASTYALTTAQTALAASGGSAGIMGMLRVLVPGLFSLVGVNTAATAATTGLTFASRANAAALGLSATATTTASVAMGTATIGARVAAVAFTAMGIAIPVVGLLALGAALVPVGGSAISAAGGMDKMAAAAAAGGRSALQLVGDVNRSITLMDSLNEGQAKYAGLTNLLAGAFNSQAISDATHQIALADGELAAMVASGAAAEAAAAVAAYGFTAAQVATQLPQYTKAAREARLATGNGGSVDLRNAIAAVGDEAAGAGGGGGGGAAEKLRTLVDYASDLQNVFSRSFEIRFGGQQGFDGITTAWHTARNAAADLQQQIADLNAEMQDLTADRATQEYWLSVAENYGDVLRAGELRASLAKIDADLAKKSKALTTATDKSSKSLVGNSEGAIANRAEILGLVQGYQGYITALASSGVGQDELAATAAQLKQDFMAQATQLGYNTNELGTYAAAFDDVTTAIQNVPRNVSVEANIGPALTALAELQSKLASISSSTYTMPIKTSVDNSELIRSIEAEMALTIARMNLGGYSTAAANYHAALQAALTRVRGYESGGYTGGGGTSDIAGFVHGQEYVFSAKAVRNIGVANLANLHKSARRGYANGGSVGRSAPGGGGMGSGPGFVSLSPADRQLLVDIRDRSGIVLDTAPIGNSVMAQNTNASQRRNA